MHPENIDDTYDVVDPYVVVYIRGSMYDEIHNSIYKTDVVDNNGFNPVWNSQIFEFNITCPELSWIVFKVLDKDVTVDTLLG